MRLCLYCIALASGALQAPLHAQRAAPEHWLITAVTADGRDTTVRHARLRWSADTLTGEINRFESLGGRADGNEVRLKWHDFKRPAYQVLARRRAAGVLDGVLTVRGTSAASGTFRAVRMLSGDAFARLTSAATEHWTIARPTFDADSMLYHLWLRWSGDSLFGRIGPDSGILVGAIRDGAAELQWLDNEGFVVTLEGVRTPNGALRGPPPRGGPQRGEWWARRDPPRRTPTSIPFSPVGSIAQHAARNPPVLRVAPGDTVRVRGTRGPAVPPIYVEGAYRGDVVVVRILAIRPTPLRAGMGTALDTNWLSPGLLRRTPVEPWNPTLFTLDTLAGVARIDRELPRLGRLTVPLRPHVGMIGVSPAGTSTMSAGEEGGHGGNLDYNALGAGTTVYLPVHHAGALLSVGGDVHAAQGDGELAYNGLEAHADIDYVVEVQEGGGLTWLRAEDHSYLMAFGSSEDLNVALRVAVSNLVEWLESEHQLDNREIALLIGAAAELDIANVFGTQRTIVAKIPKRLLPSASTPKDR